MSKTEHNPAAILWQNVRVLDKKDTTSEQLRNDAARLRETANQLMEHAAMLISRSIELEKRILQRPA
jgi:hypothetical protein